jgi:hypothetical protein
MEDYEVHAPESRSAAKLGRSALQIAGGAVPFVGGFLSAVAGAWSEKDQEKVNQFFEQWIQMIKDEIREKEQTVAEVMARLVLQDEKISKRLESEEYHRSSKRHSETGPGLKAKRSAS